MELARARRLEPAVQPVPPEHPAKETRAEVSMLIEEAAFRELLNTGKIIEPGRFINPELRAGSVINVVSEVAGMRFERQAQVIRVDKDKKDDSVTLILELIEN